MNMPSLSCSYIVISHVRRRRSFSLEIGGMIRMPLTFIVDDGSLGVLCQESSSLHVSYDSVWM